MATPNVWAGVPPAALMQKGDKHNAFVLTPPGNYAILDSGQCYHSRQPIPSRHDSPIGAFTCKR